MKTYTPINIPRSTHYGINFYNTYSTKIKRKVAFYSQLEYHNFLTLEFNPSVINFCEQPLKIEIDVDGKRESSIFDMWVLYETGFEEFQEVKYQKELVDNLTSSRSIDQIEKQKLWCQSNGYLHSIRTENDIYLGPFYISNLKYNVKKSIIDGREKYLI